MLPMAAKLFSTGQWPVILKDLKFSLPQRISVKDQLTLITTAP